MRTWTNKELNALISEYPGCNNPRELADKLGKSYNALKSKATLLKLHRQFQAGKGKTTSTPDIDSFIKKHYLSLPQKVMAEKVGKSHTFIIGRLRQLGLEIPVNVRKKFAVESRFKAGALPANKGKKWSEFMTPEGQARSRTTTFKKGQLPHNTKEDFAITSRSDKRGVQYQFIRAGLGKWVPLHRFIWEQNFGKIPPKMNLVFKNKNTFDCRIENLELLSNADLMARNSYHNYTKPIALTIQLQGVLTRQIRKHLKKLSGEKQNK